MGPRLPAAMLPAPAEYGGHRYLLARRHTAKPAQNFAICLTLVNSPVFHPSQRCAHRASAGQQRRPFFPYCRTCGPKKVEGPSIANPPFAEDLLCLWEVMLCATLAQKFSKKPLYEIFRGRTHSYRCVGGVLQLFAAPAMSWPCAE